MTRRSMAEHDDPTHAKQWLQTLAGVPDGTPLKTVWPKDEPFPIRLHGAKVYQTEFGPVIGELLSER